MAQNLCTNCGGEGGRELGNGENETCRVCNGSGYLPLDVCPTCQGACNVFEPEDNKWVPCGRCNGAGQI
jgi:DnaJ-class molecular chaperone